MKKILLINPPQISAKKNNDSSIYVPIGLLYIAASIRDICEVKIIDYTLEYNFCDSNDKTSEIQAWQESIRNSIDSYSPDIVGVSILSTTRYLDAVEVSKNCKLSNKKPIIIFGGPDPSVRFHDILKDGHCDYCVVGEGEFVMKDLIEALTVGNVTTDIPGLAQMIKGVVSYTQSQKIENLDEIPFPAYDLIDLSKYLNNKNLYVNRSLIPQKSISVITSRGCPFGCFFCSIELHMGKEYRSHSAEYVIKHLELLVNELKIKNIHFEDDNISYDKSRFEEILDSIINNKISFKWDTPNGIRADTLDRNILSKMRKSGCNQITLAIESGSQKVLNDIICKKTDLNYIIKVARMAKKNNLRPKAFYVIGFPGETIEEMRMTINLSIKLLKNPGVMPVMMIATPTFGTKLYKECVDNGYVDKTELHKRFFSHAELYRSPLIHTNEFSQQDVKSLFDSYDKQYKKNILSFALKNPKYLLKIIAKRLN